MAIGALGDVVNDVALAADPARVREASLNLTSLKARGVQGAIDDPLGSAGAVVRARGFDAYATRAALKSDTARHVSMPGGAAASGNSPYQKLEALLLQNYVESMMPKDSEALFGKGIAGSLWKSMLAEQMSVQIAKNGGVGIAQMLEKAAKKA